MSFLDYGASFISFVTLGRTNLARLQVEARCRLTAITGERSEYWLVASCKAETVHVERELFQQPNYDFAMIFGVRRYRILRTAASHAGVAEETGDLVDRFDEARYHLRQARGVKPLVRERDIIDACDDGWPLIARHTFTDPETEITAMLEYPVKTFNLSPVDHCWQTDTGPLLLPEGAGWQGDLSAFRLAYAAFNRWDAAEFILRTPHELAPGVLVDHYTEIREIACENELWGVPVC